MDRCTSNGCLATPRIPSLSLGSRSTHFTPKCWIMTTRVGGSSGVQNGSSVDTYPQNPCHASMVTSSPTLCIRPGPRLFSSEAPMPAAAWYGSASIRCRVWREWATSAPTSFGCHLFWKEQEENWDGRQDVQGWSLGESGGSGVGA